MFLRKSSSQKEVNKQTQHSPYAGHKYQTFWCSCWIRASLTNVLCRAITWLNSSSPNAKRLLNSDSIEKYRKCEVIEDDRSIVQGSDASWCTASRMIPTESNHKRISSACKKYAKNQYKSIMPHNATYFWSNIIKPQTFTVCDVCKADASWWDRHSSQCTHWSCTSMLWSHQCIWFKTLHGPKVQATANCTSAVPMNQN